MTANIKYFVIQYTEVAKCYKPRTGITYIKSPLESYLLNSIPEAHFPSRLPADLGSGGIQTKVQVCHCLELGVLLLAGVYKVLDFCHCEFSESRNRRAKSCMLHYGNNKQGPIFNFVP